MRDFEHGPGTRDGTARGGLVRVFARSAGLCLIGVTITALALYCVAGNVSFAQAARRGDGGDPTQRALAKAQYMMRELSQEKAALQGENARLQEELEKLQSDKKRLQGRLGETEALLARYRETDASLRDLLEKTRSRFRDAVEQCRTKVAKLRGRIRELDTARQKLERVRAEQDVRIDTCETRNVKLYQAGVELIEHYENKNVWDALLQKEPVTQLKRVEIENLVEDYRYRLDGLKLQESDGAVR